MTILIKPFLFLIAFGPIAVLFASVFGLACLLLMMCVRAIAWLPRAATELLNAVNPIGKYPVGDAKMHGPQSASR